MLCIHVVQSKHNLLFCSQNQHLMSPVIEFLREHHTTFCEEIEVHIILIPSEVSIMVRW